MPKKIVDPTLADDLKDESIPEDVRVLAAEVGSVDLATAILAVDDSLFPEDIDECIGLLEACRSVEGKRMSKWLKLAKSIGKQLQQARNEYTSAQARTLAVFNEVANVDGFNRGNRAAS